MVKVGAGTLTLEDFGKILYNGEKIELDASAVEKVDTSHQFLKEFLQSKTYLRHQYRFWPDGAV